MSKEVGDALKRVVANQLKDVQLSDYGIATVVDANGPVIQLDGNMGPILKEAIDVPDYLTKFEVEVTGTFHDEDHTGKLIIDNSLKTGDKVYYLKQIGAQKYLIIGRIV